MQIYKEISILTSNQKKKMKRKYKHHLYGFNSVKKNFQLAIGLKWPKKKIETFMEKRIKYQ